MESIITLIIIFISIFVSLKKNKSKESKAATPKPFTPYQHSEASAQPVAKPETSQPIPQKNQAALNNKPLKQGKTPVTPNVSPTMSKANKVAFEETDFNRDFLKDSNLLSTDYINMGMTLWIESPRMQEIEDLITTGYPVKLPSDRDFVAEGLALIESHTSGNTLNTKF